MVSAKSNSTSYPLSDIEDPQCCTHHNWCAAFGQSPDVGTVSEETHRQQNTGAGITVSPLRKRLVTEAAYSARIRCGWKSGKVGPPYGAGASPALLFTSLLLVALLTPAPNQRAAHMFVLSEIARKSYVQLPLNFEPLVTGAESQTEVTSQSPAPEPAALPAVLDQLAAKYRPLIDRVLARLSEAERREINTHYQADYRQSWICLSFANKGIAEPFVNASYQIYGIHPDKVWERIVADRKERLGKEYYDWYDSADILRPDVPKIPPTSSAALLDRAAAGAGTPSLAPHSCPHPNSDKERA